MKKIFLSLFVIGTFAFYVFWQQNGSTSYVAIPVADTSASNSNSVADNAVVNNIAKNYVPNNPKTIVAPKPKIIPQKTTILKPKGMYRDGAYNGNSADAYYGNIQVQAVIRNGKLSDVVFLDYPQDRGHSIQVNNHAMPILKQEAIQAQSANVNTVSGASFSSGAFRTSLGDALTQAKI